MLVLTIEPPDPQELGEALMRARADFLEMPGLQVTKAQASRLWALDAGLCSAVLETLVEANFLVRTDGATFVRAS